MRNSRTRTGVRPWRAGIAVAATAAAVVAGLATPAFAADVDMALDNNTGPVGGGNVIVGTGTNLMAGVTTPGARFIVGAATTCPATYSTASTGSVNATATKGDDDTVNITVPTIPLTTIYRVCVYVGTGGTSASQGKTSVGESYTAAAATPTLNPYANVPATTGSPVTMTATGTGAFLTGVTTPAVTFTTAASCNATYVTTSSITATSTKNATGTIATVTVPTTLTSGLTYNVCIYAGTTPTSALVGSAQYSVVPVISLSPNVGPSGGLNTLVASSTTSNFLSGVSAPGVLFTRTACPNTYTTGTGIVEATGPSPTKISNSRMSVKVPAGVALDVSEGSATYKTCVYNGSTPSSSTLVAQPLIYSIAAAVTLVSVAPASGPSQGGQEVTITGTNFPTAADAMLSVKIGGSALTGLRVNSGGTTITGTTTAHAPGSTTVSVTTLSGSKIGLSYAYTYGITVVPSTAPQAATAGVTTANPTIDIMGAGFNDLTPADDADDSAAATGGATVFLVNNSYFGAATFPFNSGLITQCTGVTVIADNELICSLDLSNTLTAAGLVVSGPAVKVPKGTYTLVIYNDVAVTNATNPAAAIDEDYSRISSGSTFTVADY